jgi:hypothetical protein
MVCLTFATTCIGGVSENLSLSCMYLIPFGGLGVLLDAGTYLLGWQRSLLLHIAQETRENKEGRLFAFSGHCLSIDMPGGAIGSISALESSYNLHVRRFVQSPRSTPPPPSILLTITLRSLQSIDHQHHNLVRTNSFLFHVWPLSCLDLSNLGNPIFLARFPVEAVNRRLRHMVSHLKVHDGSLNSERLYSYPHH